MEGITIVALPRRPVLDQPSAVGLSVGIARESSPYLLGGEVKRGRPVGVIDAGLGSPVVLRGIPHGEPSIDARVHHEPRIGRAPAIARPGLELSVVPADLLRRLR